MKKNKLLIFISLLLVLTSCNTNTSSESQRNLGPSTMTLEDFNEVDFRHISLGQYVEFEERDVYSSLKDDGKTPNENEVKVAVFIYNNDYLEDCRYQYLIKNEDYSGTNTDYFINTGVESDSENWTGSGQNQVVIGFYQDSSFNNLIDVELLKNVDDTLKEIHIRRVTLNYVTRHISTGTYKNEDTIIKIEGDECEITYKEDKYKIKGWFEGGTPVTLIATEIYKNDVLIEDSKLDFRLCYYNLMIYSKVILSLSINELIEIPETIAISSEPYTAIDRLS